MPNATDSPTPGEQERSQYSLRALFLWVTLASIFFAAIAAGMFVLLLVITPLLVLFGMLFVLPLIRLTVFGLRAVRNGQFLTGIVALISAALIETFIVCLFVFLQ